MNAIAPNFTTAPPALRRTRFRNRLMRVALLAVVLAALLMIGLPMLVVALVLAIALSPLALRVWLLWRVLRPSSTIPA